MANSLPLLFLDIDGVLLRRRQPGLLDSFELASGCLEFLEWAASRFQCRWISTRCRTEWPDGSRRAFRLADADLHKPGWAVLDLIRPAAWTVNKPEAIDPESNFWWVDDDPIEADSEWLRVHGREDRLTMISVDHDPNALTIARATLERQAQP